VFHRGSLWLTLACAPPLAACSLLLGEGFTDTSTPSTNDSGVSTDGTTNGSGDGAPTNDGSVPLIDSGTAACASDAAGVFCDDFERSDPQGNWGSLSVNDGGVVVIDKSGGASRLQSAITAADGVAQLSKDFALTPSRIRIELSLEIDTLPTAGNSYIAGMLMLNRRRSSICSRTAAASSSSSSSRTV
jgi:hypothetical protein